MLSFLRVFLLTIFPKKHNDLWTILEQCVNIFWTCFEQLSIGQKAMARPIIIIIIIRILSVGLPACMSVCLCAYGNIRTAVFQTCSATRKCQKRLAIPCNYNSSKPRKCTRVTCKDTMYIYVMLMMIALGPHEWWWWWWWWWWWQAKFSAYYVYATHLAEMPEVGCFHARDFRDDLNSIEDHEAFVGELIRLLNLSLIHIWRCRRRG